MNGIAVLVSLAAVGVDYGWQPASDGQLEYIIQIEPTLLEGLRNGQEIASEILPEARNVRRVRIRVGSGPVPRVGHLASSTSPRSLTTPGAGGSVMPPNNSWTSSTPAGANTTAGDFRPDGFLNLPPPPSLLPPDGMNSVLVRPGSVPPPPSTSRALELSPPPVSSSTAGNGGGAPFGITAPGNSPPGGVYPSITGDSFPTETNNSVLPPSSQPPSQLPGSFQVPPIRPPSVDSGAPNPIPFGSSGIKPPGSAPTASHGTEGLAEDTGNGTTTGSGDLLAKVGAADAASLKPTIDEETAAKLEPKPWTPLVLTTLALFASLAANVYLGWVAVGIYRRYRDMVGELHQAQASLT